jgi:hypothetical protein
MMALFPVGADWRAALVASALWIVAAAAVVLLARLASRLGGPART